MYRVLLEKKCDFGTGSGTSIIYCLHGEVRTREERDYLAWKRDPESGVFIPPRGAQDDERMEAAE